jgi:hypothetical protein
MTFTEGFYRKTHYASHTKHSLLQWTACLKSLFTGVVENNYVQQKLQGKNWTDLQTLSENLETVAQADQDKEYLQECAEITRTAWDMGFKFCTYNKGEEWVVEYAAKDRTNTQSQSCLANWPGLDDRWGGHYNVVCSPDDA